MFLDYVLWFFTTRPVIAQDASRTPISFWKATTATTGAPKVATALRGGKNHGRDLTGARVPPGLFVLWIGTLGASRRMEARMSRPGRAGTSTSGQD